MKTIAENLQIIKDSTEAIKQAIIDKGGIITGDITTYAGAIKNLENNFDDNGHNYKVVVLDNTIIDPRNTITKIVIPAKIKIIGPDSFSEYHQLQSVYFESDSELTSIEEGAFYECNNLAAITLPKGLLNIGDAAFNNCSSLTAITIPESVTSIGGAVFANCSSLTAITIPENSQLTSIGEDAFSDCSNLTDITLPESITSIGSYVFAYCSSLTSITLPESVTNIKNDAFYDCSGLTSITIPVNVINIEDEAFAGCSNLTSITCNAITPPAIDGSFTFSRVNKSIPVYVPAGSVDAYKVANYWKDFTNIQARLITFTVDSVEYQAEEGMTWEEWCNSEYNTDGWFIELDGDFIIMRNNTTPNKALYSVSNLNGVIKLIESNKNYITKQYFPSPSPTN